MPEKKDPVATNIVAPGSMRSPEVQRPSPHAEIRSAGKPWSSSAALFPTRLPQRNSAKLPPAPRWRVDRWRVRMGSRSNRRKSRSSLFSRAVPEPLSGRQGRRYVPAGEPWRIGYSFRVGKIVSGPPARGWTASLPSARKGQARRVWSNTDVDRAQEQRDPDEEGEGSGDRWSAHAVIPASCHRVIRPPDNSAAISCASDGRQSR